MIITLKKSASQKDIDTLIQRLELTGVKVNLI
ncbi:MAG: hypothetical protein HUJ53_00175, partial [Holdemanella sp.]|nr:hypothetical protein [Holdemanella sp.]